MLGVAPGADEATVRRAYVALARRHHPDVLGGDGGQMRAINEAWATLRDPVRRARYDRGLLATARPPGPEESVADQAADDDDDDDDDSPVRVTVRLPGWISLIPVGLFGLAVTSFVLGVVMVSTPLLTLALMALVLSVLFFLAAPFIALFAARTGDRGRGSSR